MSDFISESADICPLLASLKAKTFTRRCTNTHRGWYWRQNVNMHLPYLTARWLISVDLCSSLKLTECAFMCSVRLVIERLHLLLPLCRDRRGSKVWLAWVAPTGPLWVAHFAVIQSKRRLSRWNADHVPGFLLQGHPGKEGPPGEKGMAVSITNSSYSLK